MPGLVPGIDVLEVDPKLVVVDGRDIARTTFALAGRDEE